MIVNHKPGKRTIVDHKLGNPTSRRIMFKSARIKKIPRPKKVVSSPSSEPPEISLQHLWHIAITHETSIQERAKGWHDVIVDIAKKKRGADPCGWRKFYVHDAAMGDGQLLRALHRKGVPISGSDMSLQMLFDHQYHDFLDYKRGVVPQSLRPGTIARSWADLPGYYKERGGRSGVKRPNIIIVPGCSFPYAGSWDKNSTIRGVEARKNQLVGAVYNLHNTVHPGGVVIITTIPSGSFRRIKKMGKITETYKSIAYNKYPVEITEKVTHNKAKKLENWQTTIRFEDTGHKQVIKRNGYLLSAGELVKMMKNTGFINVRRIKIPGEPYDGVVGELPQQEDPRMASFKKAA